MLATSDDYTFVEEKGTKKDDANNETRETTVCHARSEHYS